MPMSLPAIYHFDLKYMYIYIYTVAPFFSKGLCCIDIVSTTFDMTFFRPCQDGLAHANLADPFKAYLPVVNQKAAMNCMLMCDCMTVACSHDENSPRQGLRPRS